MLRDNDGNVVGLSTQQSSQVKVEIAGATHRGHVRSNNEDHFLAVRFQRSLTTFCTDLEEHHREQNFEEIGYGLMVADGVGGMAAGDVASRFALGKLVDLVAGTPHWIMRFNQREDEINVRQQITQRFRQVDEALREEAKQDSSLMGMGTTLTVAISLGATLLIGHVGGSRAYVMRGQTLYQITDDHTLAQALVDAGITTPDDAAKEPLRHVLTAALGASARPVEPQVRSFRLSHNDQILLCTSGLTEMVAAETIAAVLRESSSVQSACNSLIDLALSAGSADNITVVLARYQFPKSDEPV